MTKKSPILVVGTRPELIKMAPIYQLFKAQGLQPRLILTNQQGSLVSDLLPWFGINDAINLRAPQHNSLAGKFWEICKTLSNYLAEDNHKHWVFAQGDTTTVAASALTAFYSGNKFAHIEAGLRCDTPWLPYPEEGNRRVASQVAHLNYAPTLGAVENLIRFGVTADSIYLVGNTGIDALVSSARKVKEMQWPSHFPLNSKKRILITLHRRESFGEPLKEACKAIKFIANEFDVEIVWPVHTNPIVSGVIYNEMNDLSNVHLVKPLNYPDLVSVMSDCDFILTDSGGIQEEAPALGKPVLVLRNETERMELILMGGGILVGTDFAKIVENASRLILEETFINSMTLPSSPFGDGESASKIFTNFMDFAD